MEKFNWNSALWPSVPTNWRRTEGAGVKIAVIDTGVDLAHPDLQHLDQPGHKLYPALPGFNLSRWADFSNAEVKDLFNQAPDPPGHGTQCVSILAASQSGTPYVRGVAPQAEVFIVKVTDSTGTSNSMLKNFLNALEAAAAIQPDIVLASLSYPKFNLIREIIAEDRVDAVFRLLTSKNILLFSAIQNAGPNATRFETMEGYPSLRSESINTVTLPSWLASSLPNLQADQGLHFGVACPEGMTAKPGGLRASLPAVFPNSYANYVVGGMAALFLSFLKSRNRPRPSNKAEFLDAVKDEFPALQEAINNPKNRLTIYHNLDPTT